MRKLLGPNPRRVSLLAIALLAAAPALAQQRAERPAYRNPATPLEQRVEDLLARMTQEEKIAQITTIWTQKKQLFDSAGRFDPAAARRLYPSGIGQFARPSDLQGPGSPFKTAVSRRAPDDRAGERHSALRVEHAPRHSGAVPRRGPARLRSARRHALSASHRAGELLGSGAARAGVHRRRRGKFARAACSSCSLPWSTSDATRAGVASRKRTARTRTSSASWALRPCADFRAESAARTGSRARDAEAHDRARPARERHERRTGQHLRTHSARGLLPAVPRRGGARQRAGGDAFVQRDRRRALARESLAAARRTARRNGLQRRGRQRLFRDRAVGRGASHDCRSGERRRSVRSRRAWTSICRMARRTPCCRAPWRKA